MKEHVILPAIDNPVREILERLVVHDDWDAVAAYLPDDEPDIIQPPESVPANELAFVIVDPTDRFPAVPRHLTDLLPRFGSCGTASWSVRAPAIPGQQPRLFALTAETLGSIVPINRNNKLQ